MSHQKTLLITGSNSGLGYEIVKALLQSKQSYHIIMGGRSLDKVADAIKKVSDEVPQTSSKLSSVKVDIESDDSINEAFAEVSKSHKCIDVLVNNAGAQYDPEINKGNIGMREGFNKTWDVNVTGTHILTYTFMPLLLKSEEPRLIFLASGTSVLATAGEGNTMVDKSPAKGWPKGPTPPSATAYRSAKTGLNMLMRDWARILREDGVKIHAVSPGFLATGLGSIGAENLKKFGAKDPAEGGQFVTSVIEGARDDHLNKVVSAEGVQEF